jgi:extracellular factor (EF) 3-hydroxypalmitic acid methyl ester biosynthesis protein
MASQTAITEGVRRAARELLQELVGIEPLAAQGDNPDTLFPHVALALDRCLDELRPLDLWGEENRIPSSELWNRAGHFLARGWLQNQARTKPRGYAGDYEMLDRIYEHRCCDDPLGRLFDRYFQSQAAPQAVRNRMRMMADWMVATAQRVSADDVAGSRRRIAIVGSAFGLEVRDALLRLDEKCREQIHVTLLDLDPQAIEFACAQLSALLPSAQLTATSLNLFRLPDRPQAAPALAGTHLLFCPGLLDYLDNPAATAMLRTLYAQLAPGGRLIAFQFAPHNPTRAYMEWLGNWYLLYRDFEQFRRLVESAELSSANIRFSAEPLGVDLYVEITRK